LAIILEVDHGARQIAVPYSTIEGMTEEQMETYLRTYFERDDIHVHRNDDGSIAIAVGNAPSVWPEDEVP
jgi:hypothetical protein